jgi:hypothetical protein
MNNPKFLLLMTACIKPSDYNLSNHSISRGDPIVRLNDYKIALRHWLSHQDERINSIVFVENSGYDLIELKEIVAGENTYNRKIEFLQCMASVIPTGIHYGYSELEMIDYAFEHSKLLTGADCFIKVTGRLYFPNVSKLLNKMKNQLVMADSRDFKILNKSKHYILTTIVIAEVEFYKANLYDVKKSMVKGKTDLMESIYYSILKPLYLQDPRKYMLRFPFEVEPVGVGAHWNVDYQSKKKKLESFLRNVVRTVLPKLWI